MAARVHTNLVHGDARKDCFGSTSERLLDTGFVALASRNTAPGNSFGPASSGAIWRGAGSILVFHGGIAWIFR